MQWVMRSDWWTFAIVMAATVATALALSKPSPGVTLMRCAMVLLFAEALLLVLTVLAYVLPYLKIG